MIDHIPKSLLATFGFVRCPETAKIKQKMVYSSSKDYLKNALVGIGKNVQANDHGDIMWPEILDMLIKSESATWSRNILSDSTVQT